MAVQQPVDYDFRFWQSGKSPAMSDWGQNRHRADGPTRLKPVSPIPPQKKGSKRGGRLRRPVRSHQLDGGWAQIATAIQRAAVQHHLTEAQVVGGCGHSTPTAGVVQRIRALVGLPLAACVVVAALFLQSSYGGVAKLVASCCASWAIVEYWPRHNPGSKPTAAPLVETGRLLRCTGGQRGRMPMEEN
jgi:hypothetical protein